MNIESAKPNMLKQTNLSSIRSLIRSNRIVTKAQIVNETGISPTTVRSLLSEMLEKREIESIGCGESSGGRKAERYRLKADDCFGAAFCISDTAVDYLIVNIFGEITEKGELAVEGNEIISAISIFLDDLMAQTEIKVIGFGVPGVVSGSDYLRRNSENELESFELGGYFTEKYGIPVILENSINAITIGFGRCYERDFSSEGSEKTDMAFLNFDEGCISAGFVSSGKIIRGHNNFAGEIGLIPVDGGKTLNELIADAADDSTYSKHIAKIIFWICGILNPQYIAIGGKAYRRDSHGLISDSLYAMLPDKMLPELLFSPDVLHDYFEGMAFLTSEKLFSEIQKAGESDSSTN